jgi:hypothetical protein
MYKLSVGHAKIFCNFFASMAGFWQNSVEFPAKPAGNRLPNFQKNWLNFIFPKIPYSFRTLAAFWPIFPVFNEFFWIFKNVADSLPSDFSLPVEFCNTTSNTAAAAAGGSQATIAVHAYWLPVLQLREDWSLHQRLPSAQAGQCTSLPGN